MAIYLLSLNIQHFIGHSVGRPTTIYIMYRSDHKIVQSGKKIICSQYFLENLQIQYFLL